jgi:hypothetical protein
MAQRHFYGGTNCLISLEDACAIIGYMECHESNILDSERIEKLQQDFNGNPIVCFSMNHKVVGEGRNIRKTIDNYVSKYSEKVIK